MQPFRGPPRGFPGAMLPPVAGIGGSPSHMRPPPMVVAGGGVMRPMMAPPRGGPMMFAPPSMGPPRAMALPPLGMGSEPRGPMLFGAHGVVAAGPPGVGISNMPPPPGTVDIPVPFAELPDSGPMNVFVGKLPPDLHDNYIRQLLEKCGTVVTWKRTTDPVTGKPKGFGYCTFATANDVLRALRLLNGFAVDTREILLKVDSKTQTKLDVVTKAMTEKMKLEEQERDNEIKQLLKNLCQIRSGRLGGQQNDVATWGDLLEKKTVADEKYPQQQNGVQGSGSDGAAGEQVKPDSGDQNGETRSLSSDAPVEGQVRGTMIMREVEKFRLAQEQREQEQEQKRREAILERLRREKEDEEKRRAADERRKAADERRRAAEEKRKAEEEAARIMKAEAAAARKKDRENRDDDNGEYESETDEREDGGRRKSSSSRRRDRENRDRDRKKRSTRERSRDRDRDRKRGRDHRSRSRSKSRERSSRRRRHRKSRSRSRSRTRSRSRSHHRGDRESRRKRRHRRDSSADRYRSDDDEERTRSSKRKRDSTKAKAVDGGDKGATKRDDRHGDEAGSSPSVAENAPSQSSPQPEILAAVGAAKPIVMPKVVLGLKMMSATAKKEKQVTIPAVSAFVVEEEVEAKPLRELVPIDYTEEEKLAGASVQQRVAATIARINSRSGDVKSLIDQIPTETTELFAYPIDWRAVNQNKIVQEKMEPWVKKKIVEYLGEDEPTLMEFLLKKLDQRAQPQEILNELQLVLDDDAEVFVKLLWRKLAFEAVHVSSQ